MNPEPNSEQIPARSRWSATVGAIVVIVSLCLDWYEQITGFTVFEFLDLLLVGLALVAVASLLSAFGAFRAIDVSPGRSLAAGAAALILVVSQILNDPPAAAGRGRSEQGHRNLARAGGVGADARRRGARVRAHLPRGGGEAAPRSARAAGRTATSLPSGPEPSAPRGGGGRR